MLSPLLLVRFDSIQQPQQELIEVDSDLGSISENDILEIDVQVGRILPKLTSSQSSNGEPDENDRVVEFVGAPPSAREGRAPEAPSIPARTKRGFEEIEEIN